MCYTTRPDWTLFSGPCSCFSCSPRNPAISSSSYLYGNHHFSFLFPTD